METGSGESAVLFAFFFSLGVLKLSGMAPRAGRHGAVAGASYIQGTGALTFRNGQAGAAWMYQITGEGKGMNA
ncbi:MAG TPA: hypothetical protein P5279_02330 [Anaerohalosphaeraceae bacterium]|nr:hypothetical protein [Anaerohalosphaeraceae bacterium]HRT49306.1 hypothetical protein [Anaerohalosphaeraceae bacterium]HRT85155.1 hypothetical protein [Anaerohalosphaeraceae bacterium]